MIVKNSADSINKATEVVNKILHLINNEVKDYNDEDDPAEHIYLVSHILGHLNAKIILLLEGYGRIYSINGMNKVFIKNSIDKICDEYMRFSKSYLRQ